MARYDVVIVGAGHAGAACAVSLRQAGFTGSIALVGDEPYPPYERPPLSKEYLAGDKSFERILIRPVAFWAERSIELLLGVRVTAVDPIAHSLTLEDGGTAEYGTLVWAAGGAPRRLSCVGHHLRGIHSIRTRADVDRLNAELPDVRRVVVIGGGYIGLEAAAALRKRDQDVIVIEAQDRVLARVAGEPLSRFYEDEHRRHGVDLRLRVSVECVEGETIVTGVRLADDTVIAAEAVIVGIGIVPAVAPLMAAGADGGNGVRVDGACRTSLADVYAIGDCAEHANAYAAGAYIRLESVQNANDQAQVVAMSIVGRPIDGHAVPWFWSNQYDLKLQTIGLSGGHDRAIVRGDMASRRFSVVYLKDDAVVAFDCVNMVRDYVQGRKLVEARAIVDPARLADDATPLKDLVRQEVVG